MLTESQTAILQNFGNKIVQGIKEQLSAKKINAGGDLSASVHYELFDTGMKVVALDYLFYADVGRRPGKMPPREPIKEWITEKHIQSNIPIDYLAFLIQRKIGKLGNDAYQKGGNHIVESVINDQLINDITGALAQDAIVQIKSDFFAAYGIKQ